MKGDHAKGEVCSWGPHGAATAGSETLPSRTCASCIPFHADRGMVKGLQPCQGAVLWLLALLNCGHAGSSLCLTERQRAQRAAGKLGRGSLVWGTEQGTGRAAAKHWEQPGLQWVERDRTRLFEGLVEDTCHVLELENGLSWGPSVWSLPGEL